MDRLENLLSRLNDQSQSVSPILSEFTTICQLDDIIFKDQILFESTGYQGVSQGEIPEYRLISYASILVNFNTGFRVGKGLSILEVFPQAKLQEMLMNTSIVLSYRLSDLEQWMKSGAPDLDVSTIVNLFIGKLIDMGGILSHNFGTQHYYIRLTTQFLSIGLVSN